MPKVLHLVNRWQSGGVERFIEGVVSGCDSVEFNQSILSICSEVETGVDCEVFGPLSSGAGMMSMLVGALRLFPFLKKRDFDIVHIHSNNSSAFLYAYVAKRAGVELRIVHSHNSRLGSDAGLLKHMAQGLFRALFRGCANIRLACSDDAGRHLFQNEPFDVVPNGVDVDRFSYDEVIREEVRQSLAIEDKELIIGCVGTLISAKNPLRSIEIFSLLRQYRPNAKLLFLGDGELRSEAEKTVRMLGLSDHVLFLGFVENADRYYHAMDVLLFPSIYEGFPITLVEAQCNGLPVVASSNVTEEVKITGLCKFLSLDASNQIWVNEILKCKREIQHNAAEQVRACGYDRETTIQRLLSLYCSKVE